MRKIALSIIIALFPCFCLAQIAISDEDLQNQLRSMETGPVEFSPKEYYMAFHDNGLGRDSYSVYHWEFPTFKYPLGRFVLSTDRSKAKPLVEYYRTPRIAIEIMNGTFAKEEMDQIEEQLQNETEEAVDRQVDLAYIKYKDNFNAMQNSISQNLQYCLTASNGEMLDHVTRISAMNERLCDQISYVHKDITDGIGNDMPLADREKEYMQIQDSMERVQRVSKLLVKYAIMNYDNK